MLRLLLTPLFPKPLKRMGSKGSALSGVQGQSPWPSFTRLPCQPASPRYPAARSRNVCRHEGNPCQEPGTATLFLLIDVGNQSLLNRNFLNGRRQLPRIDNRPVPLDQPNRGAVGEPARQRPPHPPRPRQSKYRPNSAGMRGGSPRWPRRRPYRSGRLPRIRWWRGPPGHDCSTFPPERRHSHEGCDGRKSARATLHGPLAGTAFYDC